MDIFSLDAAASLLTLSALEIVLGIDNIIFLSIITARLPKAQQKRARQIGLAMALGGRIVFLFSLTLIMKATAPLFALAGHGFSGRDLVLLLGGLFLLYKSVMEIHSTVEGDEEREAKGKTLSFGSAIAQIAVLDIVFALDSIITAVGLTDQIGIMILANVIAMAVMLAASEPVGAFIERHPSLKILALSFLLMVGVALVAEGTGFHIPRGYIYFSLAFSAGTECLNILVHHRKKKRGKKE
jgi:predicted tellurium resistance membrane protein TerC